MLLVALGEDDVEEVMAILFPDGMPAAVPAATDNGADDAGESVVIPQAEALMVTAVQELRDSLIRLREGALAAD